MTFTITCYPTISLDRQNPYLLVLANGMQMIDPNWRNGLAAVLAQTLGTKIVLVGKMPNGDWQIFGEERLVPEVQRVALDLVPWQSMTWQVPDPQLQPPPI